MYLTKKGQNIKALRQKAGHVAVGSESADLHRKSKSKDHKRKRDRPDKGIETMFRIASNNSQRLSDQADAKANILITVNTIIVSILLTTVVRNIDAYSNLTYPTVMLLLASLITIVFSILATRPNIPKGTFKPEEVKEKRVNLLFFGNFFRMPFSEYSNGMLKVMEDRDLLYSSLMQDVYSQGVVLGVKYRRLKIAYSVFMFGLVFSVILFFIASKYYA